ncbi:MAG: glycosyltransferase [Acidobacteriia bacterium]|nr:glycosyltransferase [Terriglobia bacterium]
MNRVLVVSYYFPPAGGTAAQRVTKFVKYLPENGWIPTVLTVHDKYYPLLDFSMLDETPESIKVERTPCIDFYRFFARVAKTKLNDVELFKFDYMDLHWYEKLIVWIRRAFFIPDARLFWLPFAVFKGLRIIKRDKIDVIFTASPPFTCALVGYVLSILTGKPWVSDYRDPWTGAYFYLKRPRLSAWVERQMERLLAKRAAWITANIEDTARKLENNYGVKRWTVIPNGYDPQDFENIVPVKNDKFTVLYAGTVNEKMHPLPVVDAMIKLFYEQPDQIGKVQFKIIGRIAPEMKRCFENPNHAFFLKPSPPVSHREIIREMLGADILVLAIPEGRPEIVSGKLFEYLRAGGLIICLDNWGASAQIVKQAKAGWTQNDYLSIYCNIRDVLRNRETGEWFWDWRTLKREDVIEQFDRRRNTARLAEILNKATEGEKR